MQDLAVELQREVRHVGGPELDERIHAVRVHRHLSKQAPIATNQSNT
jgi:hypothetical protein